MLNHLRYGIKNLVSSSVMLSVHAMNSVNWWFLLHEACSRTAKTCGHCYPLLYLILEIVFFIPRFVPVMLSYVFSDSTRLVDFLPKTI